MSRNWFNQMLTQKFILLVNHCSMTVTKYLVKTFDDGTKHQKTRRKQKQTRLKFELGSAIPFLPTDISLQT